MNAKLKNIHFVMRRWIDKEGIKGLVSAVFYIALRIINSIFVIYLASYAMYVLQNIKDPSVAFKRIIVMIGVYAALSILEKFCSQIMVTSLFLYRILEMPDLSFKLLKVPYEYAESSRGKKDFEKATDAVYSGNETGVEALMNDMVNICIDIGCLIAYSVLSARLNPLIMVILLVTGSVRLLKDEKNRRWIIEHQDEEKSWLYELHYLYRKCLDSKIGKDVRIYKIEKWFEEKFNFLRIKIMYYVKKKKNNEFKAQTIGRAAGIIRDITCYGYLVYKVMHGLSISDFVLYLGVISGLNVWIKNIFDHYAHLSQNNIIVDNFRIFMKKTELGEGEYEEAVPQSNSYTYKFENVTFYYEDEKPLFDNLNLTIQGGEKVALVGANGAGKTTLVKLMSGLYRPKSGRILINGVDISKVNPREILSLTGIVFQEANVFAESIAENVSFRLKEKTDKKKVDESLKEAGIFEDVRNMKKKEDTVLTKNLDTEGTELSGGQYQKLMLARALYKDAPVLILDEPTAALDPLAEADMYRRYNEFTKGKTSLFISHRLSSTQFCDRVIFLENGKIKQDGTHDELINEQGPYREMFMAQAHYYQKEAV